MNHDGKSGPVSRKFTFVCLSCRRAAETTVRQLRCSVCGLLMFARTNLTRTNAREAASFPVEREEIL